MHILLSWYCETWIMVARRDLIIARGKCHDSWLAVWRVDVEQAGRSVYRSIELQAGFIFRQIQALLTST